MTRETGEFAVGANVAAPPLSAEQWQMILEALWVYWAQVTQVGLFGNVDYSAKAERIDALLDYLEERLCEPDDV
jgi:hypothetical protein